jgi:ribosomal protein L23
MINFMNFKILKFVKKFEIFLAILRFFEVGKKVRTTVPDWPVKHMGREYKGFNQERVH